MNLHFKKTFKAHTILWLAPAIFAALLLVLFSPTGVGAVQDGSIVKGSNSNALYYVSSNQRFAFPNENIYHSWFSNFNGVVKLSAEELAALPLVGNVQYHPGVILIKLESDPKVYAIGANGLLRWIASEQVAQKLYGKQWFLLVDNVPDVFFPSYTIGNPIHVEQDFDPEVEEEFTETIAQNLGHRERMKQKHQIATMKARMCKHLEKRVNRIQERLERFGIEVKDVVGEDFLERCTVDKSKGGLATTTPDVIDEKKIKLCHIPPGNPGGAHTIEVGKAAARAHLAHGDTIGECSEGDDDDDVPADTTPPIISNLSATPSTTTAVISWMTNEPADSLVKYASTTLTTATTTLASSNASLVTSHSLNLANLTASTTYYYMAESKDASNNKATSSQQSFVTY